MKKIKNFGLFVTENINIKENMITDIISSASGLDPMMTAAYYLGLAIEAVAITGMAGIIGKTAGSAILNTLKNSKLGERGKDFADKIKELGNKGASIFKTKQKDENFTTEVNEILDEYQDVLDKLKDGELGEDGKKFADTVDKAKQQ